MVSGGTSSRGTNRQPVSSVMCCNFFIQAKLGQEAVGEDCGGVHHAVFD